MFATDARSVLSTNGVGNAPHAVLATRIAAARRENGSRSFIMGVEEVIEWKIGTESVAMELHLVELGATRGAGTWSILCHDARHGENLCRLPLFLAHGEMLSWFSPFGR